jgi:hypothetical protein
VRLLAPKSAQQSDRQRVASLGRPVSLVARASVPAVLGGRTDFEDDRNKHRGWGVTVRTPGRVPISAPQFGICAGTSWPNRPPDSKRVSRLFSVGTGKTGRTHRPPGFSELDRVP